MAKMEPTDNGEQIPPMYREFIEAISKAKTETLLPYWSIDLALDFQPSLNIVSEHSIFEWS